MIKEHHLTDQESKELLRSRLYIALTGEEKPFLDVLKKYWIGRKYNMRDLLEPMKACGANRVILFGEGETMALNLNALELCEMPIAVLCFLEKPEVDCICSDCKKIISANKLNDPDYNDCIVVISSQKQRKQIRSALKEGYGRNRGMDQARGKKIFSGF